MISVHYAGCNIAGVKLLNKVGDVLLVAGCNSVYLTQDIVLAQGERLLGIRSQQFDNTNICGTCHCNMVFVIGRV